MLIVIGLLQTASLPKLNVFESSKIFPQPQAPNPAKKSVYWNCIESQQKYNEQKVTRI